MCGIDPACGNRFNISTSLGSKPYKRPICDPLSRFCLSTLNALGGFKSSVKYTTKSPLESILNVPCIGCVCLKFRSIPVATMFGLYNIVYVLSSHIPISLLGFTLLTTSITKRTTLLSLTSILPITLSFCAPVVGLFPKCPASSVPPSLERDPFLLLTIAFLAYLQVPSGWSICAVSLNNPFINLTRRRNDCLS